MTRPFGENESAYIPVRDEGVDVCCTSVVDEVFQTRRTPLWVQDARKRLFGEYATPQTNPEFGREFPTALYAAASQTITDLSSEQDAMVRPSGEYVTQESGSV